MKKISLGILSIIVLLIVGICIPVYLIDNNAESFTGDQQRYAQYSILHTQQAYDDSLQQLLTFKYSIKEVKKVSSSEKSCGTWPYGNEKAIIKGDYQSKIQAYTLFGIPLYTYTIHCEESSRFN